MKKNLTVLLIVSVIILVGCGSNKTVDKSVPPKQANVGVERIIYASKQRSCTCVLEFEDIDTMIKIGQEKDAMLYDVMLKTGKLLLVKDNTEVMSYYSDEYRGFVPVVFMEGEFKGRRAYVLSNRLKEIK